MIILTHRNFDKHFKKLHKNHKKKVIEKLSVFIKDEFSPLLNNHPLQGKYSGFRSINITGDLRIIYKVVNKDIRVLVAIGSHSHLYE